MATIVTKNSSTASSVPVPGDLVQGELAVNVTDKKIYTKDSGGTVVVLAEPAAAAEVTLTNTATLTNKTIDYANNTLTGVVGVTATQTLTNKTITGTKETKTAIGASDIDMSAGNYFSKTISGTTTFTVSNVPSTGTAVSFILDLTNGGSATVNWWAGMDWPAGTAPTLTAAGRDVLGFFTYDGGTTWTGLVLGLDVK